MYYRGKYTYRKPQFVDISWTVGAKRLDSGWSAGLTSEGFVAESPQGRQYLIEYVSGEFDPQCLLSDFVELHRESSNLEVLKRKIHPRFQVRIIQKSNRPGVYRGVVNRRLTPTAHKKIISAVLDYVDANQ